MIGGYAAMEDERIVALEERAKSNSHRLDQVEKGLLELRELTTTVATMATELKHTNQQVEEIRDDVKSLTAKPGKRWDTVIDIIIGAVVAAVIGMLSGGLL